MEVRKNANDLLTQSSFNGFREHTKCRKTNDAHRHMDIDYKSSLGLRSNDLTIGTQTIKENLAEILLKVAVSILTLTLVQNKAQLGINYQLVKYFNCCSDIIKKGINFCFLRKVKIVE
jgi:hypothetical protein